MSTTLTETQRGELHAPQCATVWLHLVTITHDDLVAPIRLVDDRADIVSRSNTYTAWPFEIELPGEDPESFPGATLSLCVVDRTVLSQIRALSSAPAVTVEVIRQSAPDTVVVGPFSFDVASAQVSELGVTLALAHEPILNEPYPGLTYTPNRFPGMFGR